MGRLKVLYLAQHLTMGGAEELLFTVATGLPRQRFEVVVGCLTREGLIAQELRQAGARLELLPGEPGPRDPLAFWRLLRFIRAERPDIVHTFLSNAGLYGRLAAWLARVPAVYHAEQNVYSGKTARHRLFERFLVQRTTRVIACCQAVASCYQAQIGLTGPRLEVIYNAVDFASLPDRQDRQEARAELGYAEGDVVLGCVGRLTEQKGHDVLLEALAELRRDHPEARLFLAGQGPSQTALEHQVVRLGLDNAVRFLGVRRDRATLYAAMDLFVLPSRWEGLSLALVEAAGLGLPIVATDVGGNGEVISPGAGVWLIRPNDPRALAESLKAAIGAAHRHARPEVRERFDLARHLERIEASYRRALSLPPLRDAAGAGR